MGNLRRRHYQTRFSCEGDVLDGVEPVKSRRLRPLSVENCEGEDSKCQSPY